MRTIHLAGALALAALLSPIAVAQVSPPKVTDKARLEKLLAESKAMRADATAVTKKLGELALSGALPQDAAGIQAMQDMVAQLKAMNERLTRIEAEVEGIKGAEKSLPTVQKDVSDLKKTKWGNYVQFQYRDPGVSGQNDGFRMRRVRLGVTHQIDPKNTFKVSFDVAGSQFGSSVNEPMDSTAQLRDAFLTHQATEATSVIVGRQPLPLGYEIERSSSEREFPERAQYNQMLFPGERSTGIQGRHAINENLKVHVGAFNSLTFNDPQQRATSGAVGSKLAATAGMRLTGKQYSLGISGLFGERHEQVTGAVVNPTNDRQFVYLDGTYTGLFDPRIFVRGELMFGKDRMPASGAVAGNVERDMEGAHLVLGMNLDDRNQVSVKWEGFDPDDDVSGDKFSGWGLAYSHWLSKGVKLTAAYEDFKDETRATDERYQVTTLRVQFKF